MKYILFTVILLLPLINNLEAGMCVMGTEYFCDEISKGKFKDEKELSYMLECLTINAVEGPVDYGNYLSKYNECMQEMFKIRPKVLNFIYKYINSNNKEVKEYAIKALIFYRGNNAYEYLINSEINSIEKAILMGYLNDKRSVPLLIEIFNEYDKKFPENDAKHNLQKVNMLNVAYILASPEMEIFLRNIIKNNKRPLIQRQKAENILSKLNIK
jgi:hypothetical protein